MDVRSPDSPMTAKHMWASPYAALGDAFVVPLQAAPLTAPYWVGRNAALGQELGLPAGWTASDDWLQALSGNATLPGMQPVASVYSGHQFGVWAGQLGDGRALLLGELAGHEIQLKGAGRTPFSRMGDGRAVLRSSIREFLCSEAMHGLGIPTTRALCVTGSDDPVRREDMETAAVVTRVARSFVRFGHFEHFCHHDQPEQLRQLADYVVDRYFPQCRATASGPAVYAALLAEVTRLTAELMAQWQSVGFCHGVMNTDNMSILGLTLDYGPFQFLDGYDPAHICNHSDHQGRYAFHKQPNVAYWNLFCLGQALFPLIEDQDMAIAALEPYRALYPQAFGTRMAAKLGFAQLQDAHKPLIEDILKLLAAQRVDFTIFWRSLSHWVGDGNDARVRDLFLQPDGITQWLKDYAAQLEDREQTAQRMLRTNPKFVLRNHLAELAIRAAKQKDFQMTADLLKVLAAPFDEHPQHADWAGFPPDWASGIEISCSS